MTGGATDPTGIRLLIGEGDLSLAKGDLLPDELGVLGTMVMVTGPAGPALLSAYMTVVEIQVAITEIGVTEGPRFCQHLLEILVTPQA